MLKNGRAIESQGFQRQREKTRVHARFMSTFKRWFFRFSLGLLILLSGILISQKCADSTFFPVKHIKIVGDLSVVSREHLQKVMLPFTKKGFLRFDSRGLKDKLLQETWIDTVVIKRFWPDTIAVNFTTRVPVALVAKHELLDTQGNIFSAGHVDVTALSLPVFIAPLDQQKYLLQSYQRMRPFISELKLKIKLLKLVDRQYWYLRLDSGLSLYLSYEKPERELQHFVQVYPEIIADKMAVIDYVDLRYAHGMAVKFKKRV